MAGGWHLNSWVRHILSCTVPSAARALLVHSGNVELPSVTEWDLSAKKLRSHKCKPESVQRSREIGVFLQDRGNRLWEECILLKACISDSSECPNYLSPALDDKYGIFLCGEMIATHDSLYTGIQPIFRCSLPTWKVLVICSLCLICGDWFPQQQFVLTPLVTENIEKAK